MTDHTLLRLQHALAAGSARDLTCRIPLLPGRIGFDLVERATGPFAQVDLVDCRHYLSRRAAMLSDGSGGLARALQRARLHHLYALPRQSHANLRCLLPPIGI